MSFLTVNAIPFPASEGREGIVQIGERERAFSGALLSSIRATKGTWDLTTKPIPASEMAAWRALLGGRGEHFSFNDSTYYTYSAKGLPKTSGSPSRQTATPAAKFGSAYLRLAAGAQASWQANATGAWTLMVWRYESGAWHHYALCSDGTKYRDGSSYGSAIAFLAVSGGAIVLGDSGAGADQNFDDLVYLPAVIPAAWAAVWGVAASAFSDLPRVEIAGDAIDGAPLEAEARDLNSQFQPFRDGAASAWDSAGRRLSLVLEQV